MWRVWALGIRSGSASQGYYIQAFCRSWRPWHPWRESSDKGQTSKRRKDLGQQECSMSPQLLPTSSFCFAMVVCFVNVGDKKGKKEAQDELKIVWLNMSRSGSTAPAKGRLQDNLKEIKVLCGCSNKSDVWSRSCQTFLILRERSKQFAFVYNTSTRTPAQKNLRQMGDFPSHRWAALHTQMQGLTLKMSKPYSKITPWARITSLETQSGFQWTPLL